LNPRPHKGVRLFGEGDYHWAEYPSGHTLIKLKILSTSLILIISKFGNLSNKIQKESPPSPIIHLGWAKINRDVAIAMIPHSFEVAICRELEMMQNLSSMLL
jgi:hypothetical protein